MQRHPALAFRHHQRGAAKSRAVFSACWRQPSRSAFRSSIWARSIWCWFRRTPWSSSFASTRILNTAISTAEPVSDWLLLGVSDRLSLPLATGLRLATGNTLNNSSSVMSHPPRLAFLVAESRPLEMALDIELFDTSAARAACPRLNISNPPAQRFHKSWFNLDGTVTGGLRRSPPTPEPSTKTTSWYVADPPGGQNAIAGGADDPHPHIFGSHERPRPMIRPQSGGRKCGLESLLKNRFHGDRPGADEYCYRPIGARDGGGSGRWLRLNLRDAATETRGFRHSGADTTHLSSNTSGAGWFASARSWNRETSRNCKSRGPES